MSLNESAELATKILALNAVNKAKFKKRMNRSKQNSKK